MGLGLVDLVLFGLVATLSPVAFAASLVVIRAGRLKAISFAIGFVAAQSVACAALVALGGWSRPNRGTAHPTAKALIELAFGIWVLSLGWRAHHRPEKLPSTPSDRRSQAVLDRLGRLHAATTFLAGLLLGVGGPKRLVVTALAAGSIAASATAGTAETLALVGLYAAIATAIVWLPVLAFVLVGDRAVTTIDQTVRWVAGRQRTAMFAASLVIGGAAIASGVADLL